MQLANWDGIVDTEAQWQDNFKDRLIISGFMKDGTLGPPPPLSVLQQPAHPR